MRRLAACRMDERVRQSGYRRGIASLGEMLVALVIGAMVLTAILTVYGQANRAAESVLSRIDSPALASEVLQLLEEDLDRVMGNGQDFSLQIQNGLTNGFTTAQLVLRRTMRDSKNEEKVFEEITWRAGYDYDGTSPGLVIYRSHEGVDVEDKLLDPKRESWESNYPLVPLCRGVTLFQIQVPKGEDFVDQWTEAGMPPGVKVTLSFAAPHETVRGTWDVYDEEKITRTIAVDKTRKLKFVMAGATGPGGQAADPNSKDAAGQTAGTSGEKSAQQAGGQTGGQPPKKFGESPFPKAGERAPVRRK